MKTQLRPQDVFTQDQLDGIKKAVQAAELKTSGEIRVVIRSVCEKGLSAKDQALSDFEKFGLANTQDKTGVLILIILQKKEVQVLADKGINDRTPDKFWQCVVEIIINGFKQNNPFKGICDAVSEVGELLHEKFPRKPGDINELEDKAILVD